MTTYRIAEVLAKASSTARGVYLVSNGSETIKVMALTQKNAKAGIFAAVWNEEKAGFFAA